MAYYLARARPKTHLMAELEQQLAQSAFITMRPFGHSLTYGLCGLRLESDDTVVWEEEDYCSPPLAMERAAVLDKYFTDIQVENVRQGEGWAHINNLPRLFPDLSSTR